MLLREIVSEVIEKGSETHAEDVIKKMLFTMPEVDIWSGGWYLLKKTNQSLNRPKRPKSYILKTTKSKNRTKTSILNNTPSKRTSNIIYTPSTTLQELVKQKIITKTECKRCKYKGLWTIGDVQEKIERHNLTRTSTRFTEFTINLWFKIVGLLEPPTKVEPTKAEPIKETYKTATLPNPKGTKLDDMYVKYFLMIENLTNSSFCRLKPISKNDKYRRFKSLSYLQA